MNAMEGLYQQLHSLETRAAEIRKSDYLQDCWLERTAAGGTARGKGREPGRYATLRSRKVELRPGRKFCYVPIEQVEKVEAQIERGRELRQVEKKIAKLCQKLERVESAIATIVS